MLKLNRIPFTGTFASSKVYYTSAGQDFASFVFPVIINEPFFPFLAAQTQSQQHQDCDYDLNPGFNLYPADGSRSFQAAWLLSAFPISNDNWAVNTLLNADLSSFMNPAGSYIFEPAWSFILDPDPANFEIDNVYEFLYFTEVKNK